MHLLYTSHPGNLKDMSLTDWPLPEDGGLGSLLPSLERLSLKPNKGADWNWQEYDLLLRTTVERMTHLQHLHIVVAPSYETTRSIGRHLHLRSLEISLPTTEGLNLSLIPQCFASLESLKLLSLDSLSAATNFIASISATRLETFISEIRSTRAVLHGECGSFIECISQRPFRDCLETLNVYGYPIYSDEWSMSADEFRDALRPLFKVRSLKVLTFRPPGLTTTLDNQGFLMLWTTLTSLKQVGLPRRIFVSLDTLKAVHARIDNPGEWQPQLVLIVNTSWSEEDVSPSPLSTNVDNLVIQLPEHGDGDRDTMVARVLVSAFPFLRQIFVDTKRWAPFEGEEAIPPSLLNQIEHEQRRQTGKVSWRSF
jgi:hypothetical protein